MTTPFTPDVLWKMGFFQDAVLSPDGRRVAYTQSVYNPDEDVDTSHLYLLDIARDDRRQLTHGDHSVAPPAWSPDGQTIAFLRTPPGDDAKAQIYLLPFDGGEARPLTTLEQGVGGGPVWSPDGVHIAFTARPDAEAPDLTKPFRVTRDVYRFDDIGYLDGAVQDIYIVPVAGGEPRRLTDEPTMNSQPQWSPGGDRLLYLATMSPNGHNAIYPSLRVVTLDGDSREVVGSEWGICLGHAAWLPDGRVAFAGVPAGRPIGSKGDLYVIDADGATPAENRTAGLVVGVGGALQGDIPVAYRRRAALLAIAPDGRHAYVPVQPGGAEHIYRVALGGPEAHAPVLAGERSVRLLGLAGNGLLYAADDLANPPDLYLADLDGEAERRLTNLYARALAGVARPVVEHLAFAGTDGTAVEGWLVHPPDGARPYPTILYIHGGPHGAFGHHYHLDTELLVGAGYAVLLVNHRASTGYGDAFSTAIKGDWGNLDYGDLMAGVDAAVAAGWADPDRLGVCGLSGGGNLSCWIVGQTDRFKAAVPENPVTNWVSFYGVSDIGVWFAVEELGGHPHEIPEVYARCSPITYAHRCSTPTLLVQGEHDWRCPAEQSEQFYNVLKANGCVVEMLRLPASSHGGAIYGRPALRRAQDEALLDWMNRHIRDA